MSNGYVLAAAADLAAAHEIAEGFGLDVIDASTIGDQQTTSAALAGAANVGILLSEAAARDEAFVALLGSLATAVESAQLILVSGEARGLFTFLPQSWPAMSVEEARSRASEMLRRRQAETAPAEDAERAQPLPPSETQAAEPAPQEDGAEAPQDEAPPAPEIEEEAAPADQERADSFASDAADDAPHPAAPPSEPPPDALQPAPEPPPQAEPGPPSVTRSIPEGLEPPAPPRKAAPVPAGPPVRERSDAAATGAAPRSAPTPSAPADATAFAPKKLRRGTPELVRIVVHQPKDLNAVIKAAKKIDPRTEPAPQGMSIGDIALGANVGVALEVRGGACEGTLQRRAWAGEPIDFSFAVEADPSVKQVVMLARVFVDDAQIGILAFTRKVTGPAKKPAGEGDRARLKRHKRVFLSYSSHDRETVSSIATAYQMAGVEHFWDRASLKSGEEWSPRLRREIDRADLFHLCWSRAAAQSEWVTKETEHALTRRRKQGGKPEITVQMLDGPPWAPHPPELDAINFDDFVRAAIVGYARGDGSS